MEVNFWLEVQNDGKLYHIHQESNGTKNVYEVLGFKSDSSLNLKFMYREKPDQNGGENKGV